MRTLKEAAQDWGVSYTVVKKWLAQGRLPQATRAGKIWLIPLDLPRPPPLEKGELRIRGDWNYGRRR